MHLSLKIASSGMDEDGLLGKTWSRDQYPIHTSSQGDVRPHRWSFWQAIWFASQGERLRTRAFAV